MNKKDLLELYEKTYFHGQEVKDKLFGRVQLNFALVAAAYVSLIYMVRMLDHKASMGIVVLFAISLAACVTLSIFCVIYLIKAFWGNIYLEIPTAEDIHDYRDKLIVFKNDIDNYNLAYPEEKQPDVDVDTEVENFIYEKLKKCSSHNTISNQNRSANIHNSFKWILISAIPFVLSAIIFITGDLDASSPHKEKKQTKPETLCNVDIYSSKKHFNLNFYEDEGLSMTNKNTPPPPPKPPIHPDERKVIQNNNPSPKA